METVPLYTIALGLIFLVLLFTLALMIYLVVDAYKTPQKRLQALKKQVLRLQGTETYSLRGIDDKTLGELYLWLTRLGLAYEIQHGFTEFSAASYRFYLENHKIKISSPGIMKAVEGKVIAFKQKSPS